MSLRRLWNRLCGGLGFQVTPGTSSPGDANTLWADSNAGNVPKWGSVRLVLSDTQTATGEPTGFETPSAVTREYNSTNRTITLTQSGGVVIWFQGTRYVLPSPWTSAAHDAVAGPWFLSMGAGGTISWSQTQWTFAATAMMGYANYETPAGSSFGVNETHGLMPWQVHFSDHFNRGTFRYTGGTLTVGTYAVQPASPTDADNTPGWEEAVVYDEDLPTTIAAWVQGSYTLLRFTGTGTPVFDLAQALPFRVPSGTYPQVNTVTAGTFGSAEAASGNYLNVYQILIPVTSDAGSQTYRTVLLQPQVAHASLAAAQAEDVRSLNLGQFGALSAEFVAFTRLTYRCNAAYTLATGRVRIEATAYLSGGKASQVSVTAVTPASHAVLSDRSLPNQHPSAAIDYSGGLILTGKLTQSFTQDGTGVTLTDTVLAVEQTASGITTKLWATPATGDTITIRNSGGGSNTVDGNGKNIEAAATITLADSESITLVYTGIKWIII
jgi:hypothetical protein